MGGLNEIADQETIWQLTIIFNVISRSYYVEKAKNVGNLKDTDKT